ncbi:aldose epimerase family protein [Parapedobacter lycopersici]|uniref:aldose epimerase family protein n=1 Tax=Parapedobacter lycopersici TaxID=1864939 RepID=UPI003342104D
MLHDLLPNAVDFDTRIAGKNTHLLILKNDRGVTVALSDFGARIVSLLVPDRQGLLTDVVLGFPTIRGYTDAAEQYHGATIGRFANRIAGGKFTLDGQTHTIEPNHGPNALHGGENGFHRQVWDRRVNYLQQADFYYVSASGEAGFPGKLAVRVKYRLTDNNELIISYRAETTEPTVINLTNHAYFNLNGEGNGDVLGHLARINADHYLPVDQAQIPTGAVASVANTPFDFRKAKTIGRDIGQPHDQLTPHGGYDHTYVLNTGPGPSASIVSPDTGICLEVFTNEPGLQFYTGNALDGADFGKQGKPYKQYGAFCLEAQHFPDSPNQPKFPSTQLLPGETFQSETTYRFSVMKAMGRMPDW